LNFVFTNSSYSKAEYPPYAKLRKNQVFYAKILSGSVFYTVGELDVLNNLSLSKTIGVINRFLDSDTGTNAPKYYLPVTVS